MTLATGSLSGWPLWKRLWKLNFAFWVQFPEVGSRLEALNSILVINH